MATNTSESLKKEPLKDADFQRDLEMAMKKFAGEKKVKRKLNAALAQKVGSTLPVCINGVTLVVPVDGTQFEVPESFAAHIDEWRENLPY